MAKTTTFAVTTAATAITTTIATKSLSILEDPSVASWPTTDFFIQAPLSSSVAIQRPSGTSFEFDCPGAFWPAGTVVAYVKIPTGSTTFQKFEQGF